MAEQKKSEQRKQTVRVVTGGTSGWLAKLSEHQGRIWAQLLRQPALWGLVVLVAGLVSDPRLATGLARRAQGAEEIATRDYVATRDLLLLDSETTSARRRQARDEVLPVYDRDLALERDLDASLARLFEAGRGIIESGSEDTEEARQALVQAAQLQSDDAAIDLFFEREFSPELEDRIRGLASDVFSTGVVANKASLLELRSTGVELRNVSDDQEQHVVDLFDVREYPDEVAEFVRGRERSWPGLSSQNRSVLTAWMMRNLSPNWIPNRAETQRRQQEAAEEVAEVYRQIATGQVIVRRGDRIGTTAAEALGQLAPSGWSWAMGKILLGRILLISLVMWLLWVALERMEFPTKSRRRLFCEAALLLSVALMLTRLGLVLAEALAMRGSNAPFNSSLAYTFGVPVASLALTASLLYRREIGGLLGLVYALILGVSVTNSGLEVLVYAAAGSFTATFAVERTALKHRGTLLRLGLIIAAAQVAVVLMLFTLSDKQTSLAELAWFATCALASGLLAGASASFVMPILEPLLGITTDLRLVELSNTNLPVLRRLAFDAPGTFQHSMMVANLAKAGCEAIGADAVLAHTAGLYHDIGKSYRPEYFIENQAGERNRHDQLSPNMSALILISHVKDGVKLGRQHRLPQPLIDGIEQHHGTRRINFFYRKAQEQGGEVAEADFRYPGPRPRSRVMGVLMLADGIEAASRSLQDPSLDTLRSVVDRITDDAVQDGQLDETQLTLADLSQVRDAFFYLLSNIFHRRVEYPGFKFERDQSGNRGSETVLDDLSAHGNTDLGQR